MGEGWLAGAGVPVPELNPEQERVVLHGGGPLRVGAMAGCGKTTAVVERVAHLITKVGVPPHRILMIAFSKAAGEEMARRIEKRVPGKDAGKCARTFHSIGLEIYNREVDPRQQMAIDNTGILAMKALTAAYRSIRVEPERKAATWFISAVKNGLVGGDPTLRALGGRDEGFYRLAEEAANISQGEVTGAQVIECFHKFEQIRSRDGIEHMGEHRRFVTFDDMIYESALILRDKDVGERWGLRWSHVIQDECQDENEAQAAIAEVLCRKHRNYVIVGDPSQAIYRFRGAKPERMLNFDREWPGAKTVIMGRNYRSGIEIVELANKIMDNMPAKSVITDPWGNTASMTSERQTRAFVAYTLSRDSKTEGSDVADNIVAHKNDGIPWEEQAVLVRMNRQTRDVEIALAAKGIPYRLVSGVSFFTMKEAKILLGYLRLVMDQGDADAALHAIMYPHRGLGKVAINKLLEQRAPGEAWVDAVRRLAGEFKNYQRQSIDAWLRTMNRLKEAAVDSPPARVLAMVRKLTGFDAWLKRDSEAEEDSVSNKNVDAVMEFAERYATVGDLVQSVESIVAHREANIRKQKAVRISTVHKAKGAEWKVVYLVQVANGMLPTMGADVAEERRVFYVACTRARDELWISRPVRGTERDFEDSPFIGEVELTAQPLVLGVQASPLKVGTQTKLEIG